MGKLLMVYNRLYKNMLNINTKLDNKTLAIMQGKNQLMNVVEYHSISTIMRLLCPINTSTKGKKERKNSGRRTILGKSVG